MLSDGLRSKIAGMTAMVFSILVGCSAFAQELPAESLEMPGFKPQMSYQDFGKGEAINLGNGGLTVSHPSVVSLPEDMGRVINPTRIYNSKSVEAHLYDPFNVERNDLVHGFAGKDWLVSFGRVFLRIQKTQDNNNTCQGPDGWYTTRAEYYFQDESGAEHRLFWGGGRECFTSGYAGPQTGSWYYTNDGSYLRARYDGSLWTIFCGDGSKRIAGGENAYCAPEPGQRQIQSGIGIFYYNGLKNPHTNGWYVTSLVDRAGNAVQIAYYPTQEPSVPYWGSIHTIQDRFARTVTFSLNPAGDFKQGLIQTISGPGGSETFEYTQVPWHSGQVYPYLTRVTDSEGLSTIYEYYENADSTTTLAYPSPYLALIGYPTGAVSLYKWGNFTYAYCTPNNGKAPEPGPCSPGLSFDADVVKERRLVVHPLSPQGTSGLHQRPRVDL